MKQLKEMLLKNNMMEVVEEVNGSANIVINHMLIVVVYGNTNKNVE